MDIETAYETIEVRPSKRTETSVDVLVVFGLCRQVVPSKQLAIPGGCILIICFCGRECLVVWVP